MILRPRVLIRAACVVWVIAMAFFIFLAGPIWASYEREERRLLATERRVVPQATINHPTEPAPEVKPSTVKDFANRAARLCGVDPKVLWSLFLRESSGQHYDAQGRVLRSKSLAWGLGQIKVGTARDVSPTLDIMDPWQNAVASACHFRSLMDEFGETRTALHAYHSGAGTVRRQLVQQKTRDYASDIMKGSAQ